jgi:hypothetical protein
MSSRTLRLSACICLASLASLPSLASLASLASLPAAGQQASGATGNGNSNSNDQITPGTVIQVEMSKDVDAKKAHPGDTFQAKLWNDIRVGDKVVVPKKSAIVGHVVEAQPRGKGGPESRLTIAFDKALVKGGAEIPLHGAVERVQLSPMAVAAAAKGGTQLYSPNPGSTTNIAMPAQMPEAGKGGTDDQLPAPGPTNVRDPNISLQKDASGTQTTLTDNKEDVKLKHYATLDVRIAR